MSVDDPHSLPAICVLVKIQFLEQSFLVVSNASGHGSDGEPPVHEIDEIFLVHVFGQLLVVFVSFVLLLVEGDERAFPLFDLHSLDHARQSLVRVSFGREIGQRALQCFSLIFVPRIPVLNVL